MKIAITGSSGLIGTALSAALAGDGHDVIRLVRRAPAAPDEIQWSPETFRAETLRGVTAVVNLAGAGIGDHRWTPTYKREIRSSRVDGTHRLVSALAEQDPAPEVLLNGSAIGYYGDRGDAELDESAPPGDGFLAGVVEDWEAATRPAADAGIRVVRLRTGHVLDGSGGLLGRMLPIFRLGLGAPLGDGRQYVSWISLPDWVGAARLLLRSDVDGPVNLTAPAPVTNEEFTKELGRALRRPTMPIGVPAVALRLALGELADDIVTGQRVLPRRLTEAGYQFRHPSLADALRAVM